VSNPTQVRVLCFPPPVPPCILSTSPSFFLPFLIRTAHEFRYDNNGTFTLTTVYGASASLTFNGTAVWIYGAKRANHGPYNVTLDGRVFTDDGFRDGELFQQVLFAAVDLDPTRPHTISITNSLADAKRPYLDIDSVRTLITWMGFDGLKVVGDRQR